MLNRSKIWAWALLLAVFVAGGVAGGAATSAWGDRRATNPDEPRRRPSYIERIDAEVALTADQRAAVAAVLDRYDAPTKALWREATARHDSISQEFSLRLDAIRRDVRKEISAVLDESRRVKYEQMVARSDSIRRLRRAEEKERHAR